MSVCYAIRQNLGAAFAGRVRQRRQALGLSKSEVAGGVGVSLTTIQQYENGQLPKGEYAVRLAQVLDCSLDWLLAGQGEPESAMRRGAATGEDAGLVMIPLEEARLSAGTAVWRQGGKSCGTMPFGMIFCAARAIRHRWCCCGYPATACSLTSGTMTWCSSIRRSASRGRAAFMP